MRGGLPAVIHPIELADAGTHLHGHLPFQDMHRLRTLCRDSGGEMSINLWFERDAQGLRIMHGTLAGRLGLTCQRCLQAFDWEIHIEPRLILLKPGEPADGPADEAETRTIEAPLPLSEIVEDEVLLAMPMSPMHEPQACATAVPPDGPGRPGGGPFEALARLKTGR